jgi:hypothetical protein
VLRLRRSDSTGHRGTYSACYGEQVTLHLWQAFVDSFSAYKYNERSMKPRGRSSLDTSCEEIGISNCTSVRHTRLLCSSKQMYSVAPSSSPSAPFDDFGHLSCLHFRSNPTKRESHRHPGVFSPSLRTEDKTNSRKTQISKPRVELEPQDPSVGMGEKFCASRLLW